MNVVLSSVEETIHHVDVNEDGTPLAPRVSGSAVVDVGCGLVGCDVKLEPAAGDAVALLTNSNTRPPIHLQSTADTQAERRQVEMLFVRGDSIILVSCDLV
jgi:small nuclear ribonucleoprotein (snRNP)-like protein